jgi:EAL domain-containing protein (putative c-di-GMP-specific phosphodiesterase class I)
MSEWLSKVQGWFGAGKQESQLRVMNLLAERALEPVYQPMVDLRSGVILGQEALVRTPRRMAETSFEALLDAALKERCLKNFELACLELSMERWMAQNGKGQLFVNFSAQTLVQLQESDAAGMLLHLMRKHQMSPRRVGLDLSGYTRIPQLDVLVEALRPLRDAGVTIALDNFKASENSMKAWAKVLPNVVKMAPRWTHNIAVDIEQSRVVGSMVRLTRNHNALLVAKSVESEVELRTMKNLGVDMAQGFFLGSPAPEPVRSLNLRARDVLQAADVARPSEPARQAVRPPVLKTRYSLLS